MTTNNTSTSKNGFFEGGGAVNKLPCAQSYRQGEAGVLGLPRPSLVFFIQQLKLWHSTGASKFRNSPNSIKQLNTHTKVGKFFLIL